jgi:hypothetical protein
LDSSEAVLIAQRVHSEHGLEILTRQLAIPEDLAQQARTDRLACMDGNQCRPPVRMSQEVVAETGPDH